HPGAREPPVLRAAAVSSGVAAALIAARSVRHYQPDAAAQHAVARPDGPRRLRAWAAGSAYPTAPVRERRHQCGLLPGLVPARGSARARRHGGFGYSELLAAAHDTRRPGGYG